MNLYLDNDISIANLFRAVSHAELNDVTHFGRIEAETRWIVL
jgi:hypothetical protein